MAFAAVIAVVIGAGGANAALNVISSGDRPVFVDVTPKRIADTRFNIGITGKLSSGTPKLLQVTGMVPIAPSGTATVVPNGATAVVLNVTAVSPSRSGFVSVRPGNPGGAPTTSSLNVVALVTVPNAVTVGLPTAGATAGKIQIWYQASGGPGTTDILVDVVGYYAHHNHDDAYYTKGQVKKLVFDQRTFDGAIDGVGAKIGSGAFTSSQSGTGDYLVTFDTPGLGILAGMPPNVTATPSYFCAAGTAIAADWASYTYFNGEYTQFQVRIRTYDSAAAPLDCSTQFHINFAAPASLVIPEPAAAAPDALVGRFPAGTRVECRNTPTGPFCEAAN